MLLQILVEQVQSPDGDSMSRGDWISLLSAIASIAAIFVGLWQFRRTLSQARDDRREDAISARQSRLDDATAARQLRLEDAGDARDAKLEDSRTNWLLTVIIQPSLPSIIGFYDKIISAAISALEDLINLSTHQPSGSLILRNRRVQNAATINSMKQDFEHSFITLVAGQNPIFGQKLLGSINELEDIIMDPIGKLDYSQVDKFLLSEQLYRHKSKFFALLYSEIQQESR